MKLHRGRLFDHVHLRASDLAATRRFYEATLAALSVPVVSDETHLQADELWIDAGGPGTHVHIAFQAQDRAMVDAWYHAGLEAGGRDNGAPGERDYHPGYYAAFLFDPDGNNVEAVYHGEATFSARSVEVDFEMPS